MNTVSANIGLMQMPYGVGRIHTLAIGGNRLGLKSFKALAGLFDYVGTKSCRLWIWKCMFSNRSRFSLQCLSACAWKEKKTRIVETPNERFDRDDLPGLRTFDISHMPIGEQELKSIRAVQLNLVNVEGGS